MTDWSRLDAALERRVPTLWWRDDDAIERTAALDRLISLAASVDAPLTLAVIPAYADETLARAIEGAAVTVATHGWSHANHAPADQKKAEFGAHRPLATLASEAKRGKARLDALFGDQSLPLFIPPWNRLTPDLPKALENEQFRAVSAFAQRDITHDPILRLDAHVDPIDWRGTRSAVDPQVLVDHLADLMISDPPIGLMTHHLVHDDAIWDVTRMLVTRLTRAGARWISVPELMASP